MTGGISTQGRGGDRFECGTRLISCEKEEISSQMRNGESFGRSLPSERTLRCIDRYIDIDMIFFT